MIRLFFSVFIAGFIAGSISISAGDIVWDNTLAVVPHATQTSQVQYDPYADMRLSQYPGHPNPPIYEITFPKGQKLLILGTTHNVPLGCMLPYQLAQELIEASDFAIGEIFGELLSHMPRKKNKTNSFSFLFLNSLLKKCLNLLSSFVFPHTENTPYMTQKRIQKMKDSYSKWSIRRNF